MSHPGKGNGLIVALDTSELAHLSELAAQVGPHADVLKVGLEAFVAHGPRVVTVATEHAPVFCDLKLHDIPNTVASAARAVSGLGVAMLTVHAAGGPRMLEAAVAASPGVTVLAVTVLTSLDDAALAAVGQPPAAEQVPRLALRAAEAGAGGIVCAPPDVTAVREAVGDDLVVVTPGVRPHWYGASGRGGGTGTDDQARLATPRQAIDAGADFIVVGRPVTRAEDPAAAARSIVEELSA